LDRLTNDNARQAWRLLFVDGLAFHLSMDFLDFCETRRGLLAQFPSHATHAVQQLEVVIFESLSSNYSQELDEYMLPGLGLLSIVKKNLFALFWNAQVNSSKKPLILKAFETTATKTRRQL
jgi:hypothetical protein